MRVKSSTWLQALNCSQECAVHSAPQLSVSVALLPEDPLGDVVSLQIRGEQISQRHLYALILYRICRMRFGREARDGARQLKDAGKLAA